MLRLGSKGKGRPHSGLQKDWTDRPATIQQHQPLDLVLKDPEFQKLRVNDPMEGRLNQLSRSSVQDFLDDFELQSMIAYQREALKQLFSAQPSARSTMGAASGQFDRRIFGKGFSVDGNPYLDANAANAALGEPYPRFAPTASPSKNSSGGTCEGSWTTNWCVWCQPGCLHKMQASTSPPCPSWTGH
jgi:hypothetical protein